MEHIVWFLDGYDNGCKGPTIKEFDSVWAAKGEANVRAKYSLFWKNPWGMKSGEMFDQDAKE